MEPIAYYNDNNPFSVSWLFNLMNAGEITSGHISSVDIRSVRPRDVNGFHRAHFFAGIGGWEYALRLAGWPKDLPVWTGSCPCQPFSSAGKRKGTDDERHLWPTWFNLIRECRPPVIFGEQSASSDGLKWIDAVSNDLEREGYAFGAADLPACSVGAPHLRHRLWFVAHSIGQRCDGVNAHVRGQSNLSEATRSSALGELEYADGKRTGQSFGGFSRSEATREAEGIGNRSFSVGVDIPGANGWRYPQWIFCRDGVYRPVESGSFPLVDGVSFGLDRWRSKEVEAYGNAIVPQVAATFIRAYLDGV